MAWRGRGRGRGGFTVARHDIQLSEEEKGSDVPHRFPKPVLGRMPVSASTQELTAEQQRLMVGLQHCWFCTLFLATTGACTPNASHSLQIRFERMRVGFRSSPFFMETGGPAQCSVDKSVPDVTRYWDPESADTKSEKRRPLHEVCSTSTCDHIYESGHISMQRAAAEPWPELYRWSRCMTSTCPESCSLRRKKESLQEPEK